MAQTYDIFITYEPEDGSEYARILQQELEKNGYQVYMADGPFDRHIKRALESSEAVLALLTPAYLKQTAVPESRVQEDIETAIRWDKKIISIAANGKFDSLPPRAPRKLKKYVSQERRATVRFDEENLEKDIKALIDNRIERAKDNNNLLYIGLVIAFVTVLVMAGSVLRSGKKSGDKTERVRFAKIYSQTLYNAATVNDPLAQYYLGQVYEKGLGTKADITKAISWYQKGAINGSDSAQLSIAICYLEGNGLEQDTTLAIAWLTQAATSGNAEALERLAQVAESGNEDAIQQLQSLKPADTADSTQTVTE